MNQGNEKKSISPTQINMFSRCGEQYRRRYIEKEVIPPSIAILKGTSTHKGAQFNFEQKINSHVDLKSKDVIDLAVSTFENTVKNEGVFLNEDQESIGKNKVIGEAKDSTALLTDLLMKEIAPKYQPIEVEKESKIELENASHDLKGVIDLKTDKEQIVDFKTSSKSWNQERLDRDMQYTFYAMIEKSKKGNVKPMILENLVDLKKPKVNTLETTRNLDDFKNMINRINRITEAINKGVFVPASSDSFICTEKFCGYFNVCKVRG